MGSSIGTFSRRLRSIRFLALAAGLSSPLLAWAAPLTAVKVEGSRRIEADAILEKVQLRAGAEATPEAVRADILRVFSMGYFEDIQADLRGGELVYVVRERPLVTEIVFEGSEEFEKKDLDEATGLKPFTVVNIGKVRAASQAIAKKYEEKGYYLARADFELRPVTDEARQGRNEVQLVYKITENEKVRIRKIHFLGNKYATSGDLKQVMQTAEGHAFSWMTSGGTYREGAFERDLAVLAFYYGNEGFIEAKIAKPRVTLSQDRRYIDVMITVEEGQQHFLGNVEFRGDLLFSTDELRKSFEMKEGEVFSTGKLQEQILKLTDKYGDEGYAFANVIPRPSVREGSNVVDLLIDLEKGEKVYWGKISVTGNSKTHDKVIRRELPFAEGELYNATKRKKGLERVRRLGFFGQDVNFLTSTPRGSTNILDLEIRVSEKPTGSLNVAAGYSTGAGGFNLQVQVSQNNLFGRGQQLSLNAQVDFGENGQKTFTLNFTDPKIFDTEWLGGFDLYIQQYSSADPLKNYDQRLSGGALRTGRELYDNLMLLGTYKLQHYRLTDAISDAIFTDPTKDKESFISSIEASLQYDTRNNRLDPSGGEFASVAAEFAGLGGRTFQKFVAAARVYRRVAWKLVYRSNVEYGFLANVFGNDTLPDTERFSLGGIFSLRGYPWRSIGSRVDIPAGAGMRANAVADLNRRGVGSYPFVKGGVQKLVINQELEFPLIPEADIRLALFFDAGNAWDGAFGAASPTLLTNYGWGIRWYSPLGPLRFEWGYPLTSIPTKQGKGTEFHFVIAPTF